MNATETTLQELAEKYYRCFETAKRPDGTEYVRTKYNSPPELKDLCFAAHRGIAEFLPDDWRYAMIESALGIIADADDPDEYAEQIDSAVSVYNHDRLAWLSSNLVRASYVDEQVKELGHSDQGIMGDMAYGEYAEREEVYHLVLDWLRRQLE